MISAAASPKVTAGAAVPAGPAALGAAAAVAAAVASARPAPVSAAAELIRIEGEIRALPARDDLALHLVNEIGAVVPCQMALVFAATAGRAQRWRLVAASSLTVVQRDAPLALWLTAVAARVAAQGPGDRVFDLRDVADQDDPSAAQMPFKRGLWLPLPEDDGERAAMAALLFSRDDFDESGRVVARRLGGAYGHAALALRGRAAGRPWLERLAALRLGGTVLVTALIGAALAFVQVPLATIAPVEVAPAEPVVVTASVPGVVERMLVEPGAKVSAGQPLVQLVDTTLRSEFEVSDQRLAVARARVLRFWQAAVDDPTAKRELAVAQSEQAVAQSERNYAQAMLGKAVLSADIDGVALYGDARDWMGRPVAVGEAILRVADATKTEFQMRVPVADAVNVRVGLPVEVVLDAEPLTPRAATVTRVAYKADADAAGNASFLVIAHGSTVSGKDADNTVASPAAAPQLGLRGTAQVRGEAVTLFYYLFRRPLTAVRQTLGV